MVVCSLISSQTTGRTFTKKFSRHHVDDILNNTGILIVYRAVLVQIVHHVVFRVFVYEDVRRFPPNMTALFHIFYPSVVIRRPVPTINQALLTPLLFHVVLTKPSYPTTSL